VFVKATRRLERDADFFLANYGTKFRFAGATDLIWYLVVMTLVTSEHQLRRVTVAPLSARLRSMTT
jgi:hypothetical protein